MTCSCWASVESWLLWRYASRSSLLYSGFRYTIELPLQPYKIQLYTFRVWGLAFFLPWFPDYIQLTNKHILPKYNFLSSYVKQYLSPIFPRFEKNHLICFWIIYLYSIHCHKNYCKFHNLKIWLSKKWLLGKFHALTAHHLADYKVLETRQSMQRKTKVLLSVYRANLRFFACVPFH